MAKTLEQVIGLAESFGTLESKDAISLVAHLVSILESGNVNQEWTFELIAAIALAQATRTPQRKPYLRLVTEELP